MGEPVSISCSLSKTISESLFLCNLSHKFLYGVYSNFLKKVHRTVFIELYQDLIYYVITCRLYTLKNSLLIQTLGPLGGKWKVSDGNELQVWESHSKIFKRNLYDSKITLYIWFQRVFSLQTY